MNRIVKRFIGTAMFLVILFANVSFATQEEADAAFEEILNEMTIGTITITRQGDAIADSAVLPVPTAVISKETVEAAIPNGWEYEFSKKKGALILTDVDGKKYTQTLYIQNSTGYSIPPDTAVGNLTAYGDMHVNTEGLAGLMNGNGISDKVIQMYKDETGEKITENEYFCCTYGAFEINQSLDQDISASEQASIFQIGSKTNFVFGSSENYDASNYTLDGNGSASITVEAAIDENGKTHVVNTNKELPENIVSSKVTIVGHLESGEKTDITVSASENKAGRIPFTVEESRIYRLQLYDEENNPVDMTQDMLFRSIGNNEERPECYIVGGKIQATLNAKSQYYIVTPEKGKDYRLEITAGTASITGDVSIDAPNIDEPEEDNTLFEEIEELVSKLVMALSKTLNFLLCNALDETITLDDVIFNKYSETKIDFFERNIDGSEIETTSSLIPLLRPAVNDWYRNFRNIALVGYMCILVYLGIKVLMASTTPGAKAKLKQTFVTWCTGIIMLMFFPIVMKYIILLNNGIVDYISNSCISHSNAKIDPSAEEGLIYTDYDNVIDFSTGDDYMTQVGRIAENTLKLGYALTYAILSWQLVMLVVYYYKRLFITAFLIIIFPIVALMYVWDKLNDGKSQSFSIWVREFVMCVFVQTFHAIVYVFVVNVIYSTLNANSYDFIILMIASSFLFAGENILKSIFGGGGEALGSASQTARKISVITTVTTRVGGKVIRNVISKDGYLRKGVASIGQARKWGYLNRKDADGIRNIDRIATNEAAQMRINKILPTEGQITPTIREAAEVVDTLNNADKMKPEQLASAMDKYNKLMKKRQDGSMTPEERRQFDAIMRNSRISMNQMDRFNKAMSNAAIAYSALGDSKDARKTIMQNLQVEVEVVFNGADPDKLWTTDKKKIKQYKYDNAPSRVVDKSKISKNTNNMIQAAFGNMQRTGIRGIERHDVRDVVSDKLQNTSRVYNNIRFSSGTSTPGTDENSSSSVNTLPDRNTRAQSIADKYKQQIGLKNIDSATEIQINDYAQKLAIMQEVGVQEVNVNEAYDATKAMPTNQNAREMFEQMSKLANLQSDIDSLKYMLSKKAMSDSTVTPAMRQKFANIAKSMETEAMSPTNNVPAYTIDIDIDSGNNNVSVDPYVSIMDIINSAERNNGNINDFNDMINAVSNASVIDQMVDEKMVDIRSGNQQRRIDSQDFAEKGEKYLKEQIKEYEYEEATYMGYTAEEVKKLEHAAIANILSNSASLMSDAITLPVGAMAGMAIGAANTTDGMPLAETAAGFVGGMETASQIGGKIIPGLVSDATQNKMQSKFAEKAKKRLENEEKTRLKAKTAFEDAQYANRGKADTYLTLDGFTANLIVDANNDLTAIINVRASNAEYISINEQPGAGAWQSFQENISYTFRDNDYKKTHSLYLYVKDEAGNVKNSVQYNLKV